MNNPKTIDRPDVAHPTNPIGGHEHVEALRPAGVTEPNMAKRAEPFADTDRRDTETSATPQPRQG